MYRSPNIVKRLRWAVHVARMEEGAFKIEQVNQYEGLGVDGRTTLERILKKYASKRGI